MTFRLILTLSLHNLTSSAFIITSILTRFPGPLADPPLSVRSLLDFLRTSASAIGCFFKAHYICPPVVQFNEFKNTQF